MKRCTMRLSSVDGHPDLAGDTIGETESAPCQNTLTSR